MAKEFEKDPLQEAAIETIKNSFSSGGINGSGTGAGKTYVAIKGGLERQAERVLIISQPKVMRNFADTVKALGGPELRVCANSRFRGVPAAQAKANKAACMAGEPGWYFVSRELFQREMWRMRVINHRNGKTSKKSEMFRSWDKVKPFDYLVYDECQMAAAPKSKSTKSLRHIACDFKMLQSADWFGGSLENQYHVSRTVWPEWTDQQYDDFTDWRDENCTTKYDHFAFDKKEITGEIWPGAFASSMPVYVRIPSPIEKPDPERHYVELSQQERKLYDQLREDMAAEVGDELFVVEHAHTLFHRLREANLGVFRPKDVVRKRRDRETGKFEEVPGQTVTFEPGDKSSTVDAIREIMSMHPGEPVIVLTHSNKFANKAAVDLDGLAYTGDQTDTQKSEAERAFLAGEVKCLIGTDALSEGLDGLQAVCRIAIIASRPGVGYKTPQFIGRVARRGQKREVQVYELVREDTLDEYIEKDGKVNPGVVERAISKELMLTAAKSL